MVNKHTTTTTTKFFCRTQLQITSADFVEKYQLESKFASVNYVGKILKTQNSSNLKPGKKLTQITSTSNHYEKINVKNVKELWSQNDIACIDCNNGQ